MSAPPSATGFTLSAKQKGELLGIKGVSADLIKRSTWPIGEVLRAQKEGKPGETAADERERSQRYATEAATVRAFRELIEHRTQELGCYALLHWQTLHRRCPPEVAGFDYMDAMADEHKRMAALAEDLKAVADRLDEAARDAAPRPGVRPNGLEVYLIRELAQAWWRTFKKKPGCDESSPFVEYAEAVGRICGLEITRAKVRRMLSG